MKVPTLKVMKGNMGETHRRRRVLQRIGAVFAGFLVVVVLDVGIDMALHLTGIYPPWLQPMSIDQKLKRGSGWLLVLSCFSRGWLL